MILYGKLMLKNLPIKNEKVINIDLTLDFHGQLEEAFIRLCKQLDIPVPIWLKKNTREIGLYKKTFFSNDQFIEVFPFDKFVLEIEV